MDLQPDQPVREMTIRGSRSLLRQPSEGSFRGPIVVVLRTGWDLVPVGAGEWILRSSLHKNSLVIVDVP